MKLILFVCLLTAVPKAFATVSSADCARALTDQVWANPTFTKFNRLHGDLDGNGEVTLLLRGTRPTHLTLPALTNLMNPRALSFGDDKFTYHVVHGTADDLRRDYAFILKNNTGHNLRYQILDRVGDQAPAPRLGRELARRARVLKMVAAPFLAVDQWMARHPAYARARAWVGERTLGVRTAAADRLHRGRNPAPRVQPYVRDEVRAYLDPELSLPAEARVRMITKRMYAFFAEYVPDLAQVERPESLDLSTWAMLNILEPEHYRRNAARCHDAELGEWNFNRMPREQRLATLERAWALIDAAVWRDEHRRPQFIMFEIDRTIAEYKRLVAMDRRLPAKRVSLADWTQALDLEDVPGTKFGRLQFQRPYTVIEGGDDLRWVLVHVPYARAVDADRLITEIEEAGYGRLSRAVTAQIKRGLKDDGEPMPAYGPLVNGFGKETLTRIAFDQTVFGLRPWASDKSHSFVVPMGLNADVVSDRDLEGDEIASAQLRGVLGIAIPRRMDRAVVRNGAFEILHRSWGEVEPRLVRFSYEERSGQRPLVTIVKVSDLDREAQVGHWKRLAAAREIAGIDLKIEGDAKFTFEGIGLKRIHFSDWAVAESFDRYDSTTDHALITDLLTQGEPVEVNSETRCADVARGNRTFEVCFGNVMKAFARVKSVRERTDTRP